MYRIFGLGNYGDKYQDTPHNIGRQILEIFLKNNSEKFLSLRLDKKRKSNVIYGDILGEKIELIFFEEFMNNSGDAFSGVFSKENEEEREKIIIIHDDISLPFGKTRISFDRGDGGHNGIKDIQRKIKTKSYIRVRMGVCPLDFSGECRKPDSGEAINRYLVNKQLPRKYTEKYKSYADSFENILNEIIKNGYKSAMNKFN